MSYQGPTPARSLLPLIVYICAPLGAAFAFFSRMLAPQAQPVALALAWVLIGIATAAGIACVVLNMIASRGEARDVETTL